MPKKLTWEQSSMLHDLLKEHVFEDPDNPGFAKIKDGWSTSRIALHVGCRTDSVTYRIRKELGLKLKEKVEVKTVVWEEKALDRASVDLANLIHRNHEMTMSKLSYMTELLMVIAKYHGMRNIPKENGQDLLGTGQLSLDRESIT